MNRLKKKVLNDLISAFTIPLDNIPTIFNDILLPRLLITLVRNPNTDDNNSILAFCYLIAYDSEKEAYNSFSLHSDANFNNMFQYANNLWREEKERMIKDDTLREYMRNNHTSDLESSLTIIRINKSVCESMKQFLESQVLPYLNSHHTT